MSSVDRGGRRPHIVGLVNDKREVGGATGNVAASSPLDEDVELVARDVMLLRAPVRVGA